MRLRWPAIAAASFLIGSVVAVDHPRPTSVRFAAQRAVLGTEVPFHSPPAAIPNELEAAGGWRSAGTTGAAAAEAPVQAFESESTPESGRATADRRAIFRRSVPLRPHRTSSGGGATASEHSGDSHSSEAERHLPQKVGVNVPGAEFGVDSPITPPDSMGAIGPTQFLLAINGRIRTFDKTDGSADGALDTPLDTFFGDPVTGVCDPRVRFDRHTERWFVTAIDHCLTGTADNHILIAVSDGSDVTASDWDFHSIDADEGTFNDFATLGIDEDALYIGANVFEGGEGEGEEELFFIADTHAYVVRKSSVTSGGPIVFTKFANLLNPVTGLGLVSPQGVDNFATGTNEGYFIAIDGRFPSRLDLRRVSNPGTAPTISSTIVIPTDDTAVPVAVPQPGSGSPKLDALPGVFLSNAVIRTGRLWTSHSIGVDSSGAVPPLDEPDRTGVRWYELKDLATTPSVVQEGTVFDSASTTPQNYWMSSVMVSGQGHTAMGFSRAGANATNGFASAATAGRLRTDGLGTTRSPSLIQSSTFAYDTISPSDPERWGDYSNTSLDPNDDMTMWTVQEYASAEDKWGVRIAQLKAPAPTISGFGFVPADTASDVAVVGTGFFEPGDDFPNNLTVSIDGIAQNDITSVTPSRIVLATTGLAEGSYAVTVTNPDGQAATGTLTVGGAAPKVTVAPTALSFGQVVVGTTSAAKTVTVTNSGTVRLGIGEVELGGTTPAEFIRGSDECFGASLGPNESCTVELTFEPAKTGLRSATLTIPTSASTEPEVISLSGIGVPAAVTPTATPTPAVPVLTVTSSPLIAGHVASIEGTNFSPIGLFEIWIRSDPVRVATVRANEVGFFAVTFTIPRTVTPGAHTLEARPLGSTSVIARTAITVQAVAASVATTASPTPLSTRQPTRLPVTGGNLGELARAAVFLIGLGAALLVASRRRSVAR